MSRFELRIPPPVLALATGILMVLVDLADFDGSPLASTWMRLGAVVLAAAGFGVAISGTLAFSRLGTTIDPHHVDQVSALATGGPYRFTRNPMYLGLVTITVAVALGLGSVIGLIIGPPMLAVVLTRLQIIPEERALTKQFGDEYLAYRRSVRRWV